MSVTNVIQRPSLLRSPPSTQLTPCHIHAQPFNDLDHFKKQQPLQRTEPMSRTQHKLMLQRQSFLADDKNYLDHPENMRRLTKELDRVNREYRYLKHYGDPFLMSLKRVMAEEPPALSVASSWSSSSSLHKRPSLLSLEEERRNSFDKSNFIHRLFGSSQSKRHPHLSSFSQL